jgi:hypothetical protein
LLASQLDEEEVGMVLEFMAKMKRETNHWQNSNDPSDVIDVSQLNAYNATEEDDTKDHGTDIEVNAKPEDFSKDLKNELDPHNINEKNIETKPILLKGKGRQQRKKNEQLQVRNPTVIQGTCACPLCKKEFHISQMEDEKNYQKHVIKHRARKFECECQIGWASENGKKIHIYSVHRGPFHCDTCHKTFQSEESFVEHMAKHAVPKVIMCDACDYTTDSDLKLYGHIK